jgi:hypothetical protein
MSWEQFLDLPDDDRAEYVDGKTFVGAPPSFGHQEVRQRLRDLPKAQLGSAAIVAVGVGARSMRSWPTVESTSAACSPPVSPARVAARVTSTTANSLVTTASYPPKAPGKAPGFTVGDDQLHQRGGVDVRDQQSPARCSANAALTEIAPATTGAGTLRRSCTAGRNRPAAMRPASGVRSGSGASTATGRPCSVTSNASPAVTRRR